MAKGIDTGSHPKRKVGREDYHTTSVAAAGDWARNNAPRPSDEELRSVKMGQPGWRQAAYDLGEYDRD